ncbi:unnamed protein product [Penicillium salamii]|uniref:Profilin n=2 Tax=Penicillium salamii TaxID=1612424 RepID=A0A9W4NEJ8_9EURO|nr:unnamed protein product [Penicillium salamii]CAG8234560.1 unnamed protein product [Penicillium salamii]CAG8295840.1 unnamed protein product [Penicillium salamii]CAG8356112.1 unnamed protein product [Penicillium salamii]CAG8369125.1 unnamed protein product [Penicillium salamii]
MAGSSPDRHNRTPLLSLFSLSSSLSSLLCIFNFSAMGDHAAIWQSYVDSSLMGSGQFDKAGILAVDFSGLSAASAGFALSQEEINSLISAYTSSDNAFANGFSIAGEKFVTIKADERSLYGKKGKEGVIVARASSCTIIAHHGEGVQTTNAATVVENLVDYLNKA